MTDHDVVLGGIAVILALLWVATLIDLHNTCRLARSRAELIDSLENRVAAQGDLIAALKHRNEIEMRRSLRAEAIARRN